MIKEPHLRLVDFEVETYSILVADESINRSLRSRFPNHDTVYTYGTEKRIMFTFKIQDSWFCFSVTGDYDINLTLKFLASKAVSRRAKGMFNYRWSKEEILDVLKKTRMDIDGSELKQFMNSLSSAKRLYNVKRKTIKQSP